MCCEVLRALSDCLRCFVFFVIFAVCSGPILTVVGVVLIVRGNTNDGRKDKVDAYNKAVGEYEPLRVPAWVPGTINGGSVSFSSQPVIVYGNTDGVDSAQSDTIFVRDTFASSATYSLNGIAPFTKSGFSQSGTVVRDAYCRDRFGCSNADMNRYCRSLYGGGASFTLNSFCSGDGRCGQCSFTAYVTEICTVINKDTNQPSARLQSCFYPFSSTADQKFSSLSPPSSVVYSVRQSDDPLIALERLTEGQGQFADPSYNARDWGIGLLVVGCLINLCCIGSIFYLVCRHELKGSSGKPTTANSPDSAAVHNQGVPSGTAVFTEPYYPSNGTAHPIPPQPQPYHPRPQPVPQFVYGDGFNACERPPPSSAPPSGPTLVYGYGYGAPSHDAPPDLVRLPRQQQAPYFPPQSQLPPRTPSPAVRPSEQPYYYPSPEPVPGVVLEMSRPPQNSQAGPNSAAPPSGGAYVY